MVVQKHTTQQIYDVYPFLVNYAHFLEANDDSSKAHRVRKAKRTRWKARITCSPWWFNIAGTHNIKMDLSEELTAMMTYSQWGLLRAGINEAYKIAAGYFTGYVSPYIIYHASPMVGVIKGCENDLEYTAPDDPTFEPISMIAPQMMEIICRKYREEMPPALREKIEQALIDMREAEFV